MKHALILNVMIVLAVVLAIVVSRSPVPLFALFMLREFPYALMVPQPQVATDDGEPRIGFTAAV
jgi:hypothetical protein